MSESVRYHAFIEICQLNNRFKIHSIKKGGWRESSG